MLRGLITDSGKTLKQISNGVRGQGIPIALSTLSTWQNGQGIPQHDPDGLHRVLALERYFNVAPGTLLEPWNIHHGKGSVKGNPTQPVPVSPAVGAIATMAERIRWMENSIVLAGGGPSRTGIVRLHQEEHYVVGADRFPARSDITLTVCAFRPGIRHYWYPYSRDRHENPPAIHAAAPCRIGRTIAEDHYRAVAAEEPEVLLATEIVFDQPLIAYQPRQFSYTVDRDYLPGAIPPGEGLFRRMVTGANCRKLVMSIDFGAGSPRLERCRWQADHYEDTPLTIEGVNGLRDEIDIDNPEPGPYGWRWTW